MPDSLETTQLRRSLSLSLVVFYGLGNILGAGIYVLVGKVAGAAGMLAPLAFLLSALVASFSAFSYGELASRYPVSAGEAVYIQRGLGWRPLSIAVGIFISMAGMVSSAAIAKGFVGYLHVFVTTPDWLAIVLLLLALGTVAGWGITQSVRVASLFTIVEVGGLLLVIGAASPSLSTFPERLPEMAASLGSGAAWGGVLLGAFLAFYAFLGFEDMVNVAEEVKEPRTNLPRAIVIALVISTLLYTAVALVAVLAVPQAALAQSTAPMALVFEHATGSKPVVISVIGMFAVINGALIQIIMVSRVLYGMSRQGWIPTGFGRINSTTRTPLLATALVVFFVIVFALWVPLVALAGITSLLLLIVFTLVNLSLIRIKRREPRPEGVVFFPDWVPVGGLVLSVALIGVSLFFGI
ncbi:MAG: APC family permease [Acidiferrobacterales bacterium]|nr:APC family permease [Acidiferrobacterales bacterium]